MTQTLAQLRETVTAAATVAVTTRTGAGTAAAAEIEEVDHAAAQANLELRARLLAALFGAAAQRAQTALLPKLTRSVGAAVEDAEQAKAAAAEAEARGEAGGEGEVEGEGAALDALGKATATLEKLDAKLRQLAVSDSTDQGEEAMAVASC